MVVEVVPVVEMFVAAPAIVVSRALCEMLYESHVRDEVPVAVVTHVMHGRVILVLLQGLCGPEPPVAPIAPRHCVKMDEGKGLS